MIAGMRRHALCTTLILGLVVGFPAWASDLIRLGQPQIACPADPQLAALIAASNVVLLGRMEVPTQRLSHELQQPRPAYLDIPLQLDAVLKGSTENPTVRFLPNLGVYSPSPEDVLTLDGEPSIFFLNRIDGGAAGLYFAGYSPKSLASATEQSIAAVTTEIARQDAIVRNWTPDRYLPHYNEVRGLIQQLGRVRNTAQQRIFDRLILLGASAVPAIIAQMDDRRVLRTPEISLRNEFSGAFEGSRHYRPQQVVDGLDAVLNQITGENFGNIVNGGSDRERDAAVAGWRVYGADLGCRPSA